MSIQGDRREPQTQKPECKRVVTFMAPDVLGTDQHNDFFDVRLPHMHANSGIRMVSFLSSAPGDDRTFHGLDLGQLITGLMENQNFFPLNQHHDHVERDVYIPEGMGSTLMSRWKNEKYLITPAHVGSENTLLGVLLSSYQNYGDLDWLFNILLTRADIATKLGFNREIPNDRDPRPANEADKKEEDCKWLKFADNIYQDAMRGRNNDSRGEYYRGTPITPVWAVASERLPINDALEFLKTPVSLLAMYSGLLK